MDSELDRRQCAARNRDGERCRRYPIAGGSVCLFHGGSAPQVQAIARKRLLSLVEPAIDALDEVVERYRATRCPTCGLPTGDPGPVIRIAQLALDRSGLGPSATLSIQTASNDLPTCVDWLTTEQIVAMVEWFKAANASMERGDPRVGGNWRELEAVYESIEQVQFVQHVWVSPKAEDDGTDAAVEAEVVDNC